MAISASSPSPRRRSPSNFSKALLMAAACCSAVPKVAGLLRSALTLTSPAGPEYLIDRCPLSAWNSMVCTATPLARVTARRFTDDRMDGSTSARAATFNRGGTWASPSSASSKAPDRAAIALRSSSVSEPSVTSICTAMPSWPRAREISTLAPLAVAMLNDTVLSPCRRSRDCSALSEDVCAGTPGARSDWAVLPPSVRKRPSSAAPTSWNGLAARMLRDINADRESVIAPVCV
ncbi:hypothetical protein D3C71_1567250 [compost metagenome]